MEQILKRFIPGNSFINVEQISYNICSGELLLYTVWFLLELILCGTNIQSQTYMYDICTTTPKGTAPLLLFYISQSQSKTMNTTQSLK